MSGPRPTTAELAEILAKHAAWRRAAPGGARADLAGANLAGANLAGADLTAAALDPKESRRRQIVPECGAFVGFKQLSGGAIAELLIPSDANRVGGLTERKCRASAAVVLEIYGPGGDPAPEGAAYPSQRDPNFVYTKGAEVSPTEPFCDDPREVCAPGIHFFLTRLEAEEYR